MNTVEAIIIAKKLRDGTNLPSNVQDRDVILALLQGINDATELKDRLVIDCRANKDEADELRGLLQQMLDVAENADETGYVDGVGFVNLEKLHGEVRDALTPPINPLSKKEVDDLNADMSR
jgi:hypothetical protein